MAADDDRSTLSSRRAFLRTSLRLLPSVTLGGSGVTGAVLARGLAAARLMSEPA